MNEIISKAGNIKEMAVILATYPTPEKWTAVQKKQAVEFAALLNTAQKMISAASLVGINYESEKAKFLKNAGRSQSVHTQIAYKAALDRLEIWTERQKLSPLELTPAQADDFIYGLRGERSSASIRLDIAAASSFFTWLERRHEGIKNPFRGTKARPVKKSAKKIEIPTAQEVEIIIRDLPADLAAAVSVMAYRGLRAGIFETLSIKGNKFSGYSKGKEVSGALPSEVLDAIKNAGLSLRKPFAEVKTNTFEKRISRAIEKLFKNEKVKAIYSCHDFRHFFAVSEYQKDKDLHRVSKLLGHSSLLVTENYLKGLGEVA